MRFVSVLGSLCALVSLATAVSLEDAFTKERVNHLYPGLDQVQILDSNTVIGLARDQLLSVKLEERTLVQWAADLRKIPGGSKFSGLHLTSDQALVYLYSQEANSLYLYNSTTGVYKRSIVLHAVPETLVNFFNRGVLVLSVDGSVHHIDNTNGEVTVLETTLAPGGEPHFQQINGNGYLLDGRKVVKVSPQLAVVDETSTPFSQAIQFKDDLVVTPTGEIYRLEDSDQFREVSKLSGDVVIINSNYVASIKPSAIELYSISEENQVELSHTIVTKVDSTTELQSYALGDYLVVSNRDSSKDIYDLTDFLIVNDASSIKHVKARSSLEHSVDKITSSPDGSLLLLAYSSSGEKHNLIDGTLNSTYAPPPQYSSSQDKYYIFDRPASQKVQNIAHHILDDSKSFAIIEILKRFNRHLSEFGRFAVSKVYSSSSEIAEEIADYDEFGFRKLVVFFDDESEVLVALDSESGDLAWESKIAGKFVDLVEHDERLVVLFERVLYIISLADGTIESKEEINDEFVGLSTVTFTTDPSEAVVLKTKTQYKVHPFYPSSRDIYLVDTSDDSKVVGQKILEHQYTASQTWEFFREGETILQVISRPGATKTSSIGISLSDKSVLYKYLYPNIITIFTRDQTTNSLKLYVVDSVTGSLLYTHEHDESEVIDYSSLNTVQDDNWIIYSYFVKSPKVEQRIAVIDLFDSDKAIRSDPILESSFNYNSTIHQVTKKSFIYPERILSLSSTQSSYGITLKSIVAATESGNLIEIPKHILNSRRIDDRPLTADDYLDDYKMLAYDPVILQNSQAVVNHRHRLLIDANGKILVKPTNFESTSVICYFNKYNQFCSVVQPSSSFDLLSKQFAKVKLLGTIAILLVAYAVTRPIVSRRRLHAQWVDRS